MQACFRPSRIPRLRDFSTRYPSPTKESGSDVKDAAAADKASTDEDEDYEISYADLVTAEDIAAEEGFALSLKVIAYYQHKDRELIRKAKKESSAYTMVELEGVKLIAKHGKVIVPAALQDRIVENYHELLQHPGKTRMEATSFHYTLFMHRQLLSLEGELLPFH